MSTKERFNNKLEEHSGKVLDLLKITSPVRARALLHDDKRKIISLLIEHKAMTIQQLSKKTKINPGTIKRHIDDLINNELVFMIFDDRSEYNVKMKFYSSYARKFIIDIKIPDEK
jgi:DNA-binding transcriptional ArsR family regulator